MSEISEQLDKLISLSEQIVENTIPEADKRAAAAVAVQAERRRTRSLAREAQTASLAKRGATNSPAARLRTGPEDGNLSISATRSKLEIDQHDAEFDKLRPSTYIGGPRGHGAARRIDEKSAIARAEIDEELNRAKHYPMPVTEGGRKKKSRRTRRRKKRRTKKRRTRRTKRRT